MSKKATINDVATLLVSLGAEATPESLLSSLLKVMTPEKALEILKQEMMPKIKEANAGRERPVYFDVTVRRRVIFYDVAKVSLPAKTPDEAAKLVIDRYNSTGSWRPEGSPGVVDGYDIEVVTPTNGTVSWREE